MAEIQQCQALLQLRIDDLFVQPARFADLAHRIFSKGLRAKLGEENLRLQQLEQRMPVPDAVLRHRQKLQAFRVVFEEQ